MAQSTARKTTRRPQDHLPKATPATGATTSEATGPVRCELDGQTWRFTTDDGQTWHESKPLDEVFTPKWVRLNRRRADMDVVYTAVEDCFAGDDDALDAWDSLTFEEQGELGSALFDLMGASLGE